MKIDDADDDYSDDDDREELPNSLIYNIVTNLPAKSLIRFQCLSKEWYNIISTPVFRQHHLLIHNNNNNTRRQSNISIHYLLPKDNVVVQFTITPNMISSWCDDVRNNRPLTRTSLPQPVILQIPVNISDMGSVFIWNPISSQSRHVPCPAGHHLSSFHGLGYDDVMGGYMIVLGSVLSGSDETSESEIMSLKTSSCLWRSMDTPTWGTQVSNSVTFGGDIYWISYLRGKDICCEDKDWASQNKLEEWYYVVLQFNVINETLTVWHPPFKEKPSDNKRMELGQYCGCICFFSIDYGGFPYDEHWAHIWTLKKGEAIWNSLMDVPYSPFLKCFGRNCKFEFNTSGDLIICPDGYCLLVYLAQEKRYVAVPFIRDYDRKRHRLKFAEDFYFFQNESLQSPLCCTEE